MKAFSTVIVPENSYRVEIVMTLFFTNRSAVRPITRKT